jgi:hypothetical protein
MLREIGYGSDSGLFWFMSLCGGCFNDSKVQCLGVMPCLVE